MRKVRDVPRRIQLSLTSGSEADGLRERSRVTWVVQGGTPSRCRTGVRRP